MTYSIEYLGNYTQYMEKLARWRTNQWNKFNPNLTYGYSMKSFKEHCNTVSLPLTYIYLKDEIPIGMCSLRYTELPNHEYINPWISGLYVEKEYRNLGIGKLLIDFGEKKVLSLGYCSLNLFIFENKLKKWYESLGYIEFKSDYFYDNPIVILNKKLLY